MKETPALARAAIIAAAVLAGVVTALLFSGVIVKTYRNPGSGMEPALPAGTHMLVVRGIAAKRGDIVAFRSPPDPRVTYVKRVVAAGGDTVEIRAKQLFVNGRAMVEPYAVHRDATVYPDSPMLPEPYRSRDQFGPFRVPQNALFVLGDNRDESADSRYWGAVPRDQLIGRPVALFSWKGVRKIQ